MNLYLVGYRCTGKTTVGLLLSTKLGWGFVDMDHELAVEAGMSIQEIVSRQGWKHFRKLEGHLLERLSRQASQVVATGGGVVASTENIATMRNSGKVVWLEAGPSAIAKRMLADSSTVRQRPALRGKDALTEIKEVLKERLPLYEKAMHFSVDTDELYPQEVADRIMVWLKT